jgi:hypothetical protein
MTKLPWFAEECPDALVRLMKSDPAVAAYIESLHSQKGSATDADDLEMAENASGRAFAELIKSDPEVAEYVKSLHSQNGNNAGGAASEEGIEMPLEK